MEKITLKKMLLEDNYDDENTTVTWIDKNKLESNNMISPQEEEQEYQVNSEDPLVNGPEPSNIDINIIEENNEKKVRITLEFNVSLNNDKSELICIDMDINKKMYLKIADELRKL